MGTLIFCKTFWDRKICMLGFSRFQLHGVMILTSCMAWSVPQIEASQICECKCLTPFMNKPWHNISTSSNGVDCNSQCFQTMIADTDTPNCFMWISLAREIIWWKSSNSPFYFIQWTDLFNICLWWLSTIATLWFHPVSIIEWSLIRDHFDSEKAHDPEKARHCRMINFAKNMRQACRQPKEFPHENLQWKNQWWLVDCDLFFCFSQKENWKMQEMWMKKMEFASFQCINASRIQEHCKMLEQDLIFESSSWWWLWQSCAHSKIEGLSAQSQTSFGCSITSLCLHCLLLSDVHGPQLFISRTLADTEK